MDKRLKLSPNRALVSVLVVIAIVTAVATFFDSLLVPKISKLITVSILLTFYFCQLHKMATIFLTTFLIFFIGDAFAVFSFGELALKLSKTMYIGAYLLLIFVLLGKLKRVKFEGFISVYLILVLLLNTYFLYVLYEVARENFVDEVNLVLYIIHGIALIAMTFLSFAVYLRKENNQSIVFLLMVFSFVFADVLSYICDLYMYYWLFEVIAGILHVSGLYLLYRYVYDYQTMELHTSKLYVHEDFITTTDQFQKMSIEGNDK